MLSSAFVIIFEDSPDTLETTKELLQIEGFTDIGTAGSIDELQTNLPLWIKNMTREKPVIALIDNHAPWRKGQEPDPKGVGGIAEKMIKEAIEGVITVSTTSDDNINIGYGDYRYNRRESGINLGKFVTQLPAKER